MRKSVPGSVWEIDLGGGERAYAGELRHPFVVVYDVKSRGHLDPEHVVQQPPLFVVAVFDSAFKRWKRVRKGGTGINVPVPLRFVQNVANPTDIRITDADGREWPATPAECVGLEAAAVWEAEHVEDRIRDHYAERPNQWVEQLRLV